jgi:sterol desaturase/sphingolipid hydroxylase (fatty acid hydroxylase superfamily)
MLIAMAMEPTPQDLRTVAWVLSIIGLFTFVSLYKRLHFIKSAKDAVGPASRSKHTQRLRDRTRRLLGVFAWFNLGVFVMCGLVWVFAAKAQCLIQGWILGLVVAEGCM